jgi:hypothetical protein
MKILEWLKSFIKPKVKVPVRKAIPYNAQIYIVRVKNTSKESIDVVLFGGVDNYEKTNMYGCVDGGVFIDCPISTTSYKDILWSSMLRPFVVEYMQVNCDEEDSLKYVTLNTRDAFGTTLRRLLMPNPTINQVHKNIKEFNQDFRVDGFTSLTFNMPPESTLIYYFAEKK